MKNIKLLIAAIAAITICTISASTSEVSQFLVLGRVPKNAVDQVLGILTNNDQELIDAVKSKIEGAGMRGSYNLSSLVKLTLRAAQKNKSSLPQVTIDQGKALLANLRAKRADIAARIAAADSQAQGNANPVLADWHSSVLAELNVKLFNTDQSINKLNQQIKDTQPRVQEPVKTIQ